MNYRRDIDGLRGVAVLPVILFHANLKWFAGGFVGVDVFFVISGFLITTILISENQNQTFSIVKFYERRLRRLMPVLFFILALCLGASWAWLLPNQFVDFSKSLMGVSTFISNYYFRESTGYFAQAVEEKPLLHSWSLSVEEQFYVFFPWLIFLVWRYGRKYLWLVFLVLGVGSFYYAQWGTLHEPEKNFYDTRGRIWELVIGSMVALYIYKGRIVRFKQFGSLFGLGLILFSIFYFDKSTPFPGYYALIPTLGTAMIILFSSPETWVGKILGHKSLVGIGLISYSAYLWHQPLFAFFRIRSLTPPSEVFLLTLGALSLALAYLTWRFIENPFRNKQVIKARPLFIFIFAINSVLIILAYQVYRNDGYPQRVPRSVLMAQAGQKDNNPLVDKCRGQEPDKACRYGAKVKPTFIIWGDSHVDQLMPMMNEVGNQLGFSFLEYSFPGCPPILGVERNDSRTYLCAERTELALRSIEDAKDIKTVILHAYWYFYIDEKKVSSQNDQDVDILFDKTVERLVKSGKRIIIMTAIPKMPVDIPSYLVKVRWFSETLNPELVTSHRKNYLEENKHAHALFEELVKKYQNISVFDVGPSFCDTEGVCPSVKDESIYYRDDNHISVTGSYLLKERWLACLDVF